MPGSVAEVCLQLPGYVEEVALMLLETQSCCAYTSTDLPQTLAELPFHYHVHLPLDLPWDGGVACVLKVLETLHAKVAFLDPKIFVLHPPSAQLLRELLTRGPVWQKRLALENIQGNALDEVWPVVEEYDVGICLDLGHMVSYGQENLLKRPGVFSRIRALHIYGREQGGGKHCPLGDLPDPEILRHLLDGVRSACTQPVPVVLEVFSWEHFLASRETLRQWLAAWGMAWWNSCSEA